RTAGIYCYVIGETITPDEVAVNPELDHPHRERAGGEAASADAVDEQFLRGRQDPDGLGNFLGTVHREELGDMFEKKRAGSRRPPAGGRRAGHRRRSAFSSFSFSSFSGFVGRIRRLASTRSRMTFMYIASCSRRGDEDTIVRS